MARDRRDDYDDDDRPRRRERDDDYDDRRPRQLSGMDGFFTNQFVLAIILAICCNGLAVILGIIGLCICTDPTAKRNALIVTIIGAVITVVGLIINFAFVAGNPNLFR